MKNWLFSVMLLCRLPCIAQDSAVLNQGGNKIGLHSTGMQQRRCLLVGSGSALAYGGSFIFLNEAWYKNYPRTSFHTFNDGGEWLQMDKVGHGWTAYHTSRLNTALWQWAGADAKTATWLGAGTSMAYLLGIEYLDGRSAEWGWSWPDVAADFFGATLFAAQQFAWNEQRILFKFSAHKKNYAPELQARANRLFGSSLPERLLKDYNAQTYWLSFNVHNFLPQTTLPKWLNLAVGYSGSGMFGGYENIARDAQGNEVFNRTDIPRQRQWLLSADADLTKINTRSRFLRSVFFVLNSIKIPAPALELSYGKLKGHWLYF